MRVVDCVLNGTSSLVGGQQTKQNIKKRIEKTKTAIGKKEDRQIQLLEELDDDSDGNLSGEEDVSTS